MLDSILRMPIFVLILALKETLGITRKGYFQQILIPAQLTFRKNQNKSIRNDHIRSSTQLFAANPFG